MLHVTRSPFLLLVTLACLCPVLAFGQGVANFEVARVVEADHVARPSLFHHAFFLGQKAGRIRKLQLLVQAGVLVEGVALKVPGTHAEKGNAVAVLGVDVGVDLENEAREL